MSAIGETCRNFAHALAASSSHELAVHWLRSVPGLPPVLQTTHLVAVAVLMSSIVMINLRVLKMAAPSQQPSEMVRRLYPWMWSALIVLLVSGLPFVLARPQRYFLNPVAGGKFVLAILAVTLAIWQRRILTRTVAMGARAKGIAALSVLCWLGVVLAGRWIAYADYLLPFD